MSKHSSDQEGYDYDEIVRRLKSSAKEPQKKVVIDTDTGDKKVRVRRKKRSSNTQEKRGNNKTKRFNRILNIAWVSLLVLFVVLACFWVFRAKTVVSDKAVRLLEDKVNEQLLGEVKLDNAQVKLNHSSASRAQYSGVLAELCRELELRGINSHTDVLSLIKDNQFFGEYIQAQNGQILLDWPQGGEELQDSLSREQKWIDEGSIDIVQIHILDLVFGEPVMGDFQRIQPHLDDSNLRISTRDRSFLFTGGEINWNQWPKGKLKVMEGTLSDDLRQLEVSNVEITLLSKLAAGSIRGHGVIPWRGEGRMEMQFSSESIALEQLLRDQDIPFEDKLFGAIEIKEGFLGNKESAGSALSLSCKLETPRLRLKDWDGFDSLALLLQNDDFRDPVFEDFSAQLIWEDGIWRITDIQASVNEGYSVLTGELFWQKEQGLGGELQVHFNAVIAEKIQSLVLRDNGGRFDGVDLELLDDGSMDCRFSVRSRDDNILFQLEKFE